MLRTKAQEGKGTECIFHEKIVGNLVALNAVLHTFMHAKQWGHWLAREECDVALILSKTVTVCDSQCIVKSQLLYNSGFHLKLSLPLKLYFNMNKTPDTRHFWYPCNDGFRSGGGKGWGKPPPINVFTFLQANLYLNLFNFKYSLVCLSRF